MYIIISFRKYSRSPDIIGRVWHVELSVLNERTLNVPSKEIDERTEREYRKTRAPVDTCCINMVNIVRFNKWDRNRVQRG
jgi:hypothetical protein